MIVWNRVNGSIGTYQSGDWIGYPDNPESGAVLTYTADERTNAYLLDGMLPHGVSLISDEANKRVMISGPINGGNTIQEGPYSLDDLSHSITINSIIYIPDGEEDDDDDDDDDEESGESGSSDSYDDSLDNRSSNSYRYVARRLRFREAYEGEITGYDTYPPALKKWSLIKLNYSGTDVWFTVSDLDLSTGYIKLEKKSVDIPVEIGSVWYIREIDYTESVANSELYKTYKFVVRVESLDKTIQDDTYCEIVVDNTKNRDGEELAWLTKQSDLPDNLRSLSQVGFRFKLNNNIGTQTFYTIVGDIPPGLSLDTDGYLNGVINVLFEETEYRFIIRCDVVGAYENETRTITLDSEEFVLRVYPESQGYPIFLNNNYVLGNVDYYNEANFSVKAWVNPPTAIEYSIISGELPHDLSLNPVTGIITGLNFKTEEASFPITVRALCTETNLYTDKEYMFWTNHQYHSPDTFILYPEPSEGSNGIFKYYIGDNVYQEFIVENIDYYYTFDTVALAHQMPKGLHISFDKRETEEGAYQSVLIISGIVEPQNDYNFSFDIIWFREAVSGIRTFSMVIDSRYNENYDYRNAYIQLPHEFMKDWIEQYEQFGELSKQTGNVFIVGEDGRTYRKSLPDTTSDVTGWLCENTIYYTKNGVDPDIGDSIYERIMYCDDQRLILIDISLYNRYRHYLVFLDEVTTVSSIRVSKPLVISEDNVYEGDTQFIRREFDKDIVNNNTDVYNVKYLPKIYLARKFKLRTIPVDDEESGESGGRRKEIDLEPYFPEYNQPLAFRLSDIKYKEHTDKNGVSYIVVYREVEDFSTHFKQEVTKIPATVSSRNKNIVLRYVGEDTNEYKYGKYYWGNYDLDKWETISDTDSGILSKTLTRFYPAEAEGISKLIPLGYYETSTINYNLPTFKKLKQIILENCEPQNVEEYLEWEDPTEEFIPKLVLMYVRPEKLGSVLPIINKLNDRFTDKIYYAQSVITESYYPNYLGDKLYWFFKYINQYPKQDWREQKYDGNTPIQPVFDRIILPTAQQYNIITDLYTYDEESASCPYYDIDTESGTRIQYVLVPVTYMGDRNKFSDLPLGGNRNGDMWRVVADETFSNNTNWYWELNVWKKESEVVLIDNTIKMPWSPGVEGELVSEPLGQADLCTELQLILEEIE